MHEVVERVLAAPRTLVPMPRLHSAAPAGILAKHLVAMLFGAVRHALAGAGCHDTANQCLPIDGLSWLPQRAAALRGFMRHCAVLAVLVPMMRLLRPPRLRISRPRCARCVRCRTCWHWTC
jgi:hypothetical protein